MANAIHPISAANGSGCARHANAIEVLYTSANMIDCTRVGHRHAHKIAPATPPAKAAHVIATGTDPRGPSELTNSTTKLRASEAERNAIMARVAAAPLPRA